MREAVVVASKRTPLAKGYRGSFNMTRPDDQAAHAIRAALADIPAVADSDVEDVIIGCGLPEGPSGQNVGRIAALRAGLPSSVPGTTVNRFCSSGLNTIAMASHRVMVGEVDTIIPRADPQARTFPLKVALQQNNGTIGVGMLAQVSMPAGDTYQAIVVPKDAIVGDGANQHVFRIGPDSTVERVPVQTGEGLGDWIVIRGGIAAGEQVVTRGNERLFPGQPVTGEPVRFAETLRAG